MKQRIEQRAIEKGLLKPKKENWFMKELKPLFAHKFEDSMTDDQEKLEKKKAAKKKLKQKFKDDKMNELLILNKIEENI